VRPGAATFVGELAVDAISTLGEQYGDDARVVAASLMFVVRDGAGVHVEVMAAEVEQG
jgi:hypothetical protein